MNTVPEAVKPIPTEYAGHQFRSRLEARWAVFFDEMSIQWRYEDEGYQLPSGWYLPDFYLPSCATFIEVRGDIARVDLDDLAQKSAELPELAPNGGERGPRLLLLGPMPQRLPSTYSLTGDLSRFNGIGGDYGWMSAGDRSRYGFGTFNKNYRPWFHCNTIGDCDDPLTPTVDPFEWDDAHHAYAKAATYRFWNPR